MDSKLHDQVAFINGGSRGIGAATARRLAREGARIAIGYQSSAIAAEALVAEIEAGGG
jgi:3-oxoacyl-[acyl-carrier protein] reductase